MTSSAAQTGPVLRTFFYYMLASMLGLIAITTTSVVDGMFVGNYVGGEALAAVTLLLPCFTILYAVALALAIARPPMTRRARLGLPNPVSTRPRGLGSA